MKLAEVCVKRPVFATMLIMTFVVLGAFSYTQLGVDQFPKIDLPTVTVQTTLPGASPEEIESQITKPIEEVVNTVEGITELRSIYATSDARLTAVAERTGATLLDPVPDICGDGSHCSPFFGAGDPKFSDAMHLRAVFVRDNIAFLDFLLKRR